MSKILKVRHRRRIRCVAADSPDFDILVWDTGKVDSDESAFIVYSGEELRSRTTYYWQVKVWDEKGRESGWSETASWHMGILSDEEWKGEWIGAPCEGSGRQRSGCHTETLC